MMELMVLKIIGLTVGGVYGIIILASLLSSVVKALLFNPK